MTSATEHPAASNSRLVELLLALAVLGSVLAVGSVHAPVVVVMGLLAIAAATSALRMGTRSQPWVSAPAILIFALAAYSLAQAVPVPAKLLGSLAPANADVWQRALLPLGEAGPNWVSLSLDPGASVLEGLKWFSYACVFTAASIVAARRGPGWGVSLMFVCGLAASLTTVVHGLSGATKVYGIYQPQFPAAAWHVGPLLNPNNLAGYLNLAAVCGMGLMLSARPPAPPWMIGVGLAVIVSVSVTSGSRGGVLVLLTGTLILAAIVAWQRRAGASQARTSRSASWMMLAAAGGGAALAFLGGGPEVWQELRDKNLSKLMMIDWVQPMVREHRWFGIGRGAFESVFPAYRTEPGNIVFAHAESFPAQWISEWGVPVGAAAAGYLCWLFRPHRLGVRCSAVAAGAWVGVLTLAAHSLLDLALEVTSVMFATALVLGSLWGGSAARARPDGPAAAGAWLRRRASHLVLAVGVVIAALAAHVSRREVRNDRWEIHALYAGGAGAASAEQRARMRKELRAAMMRHPAEPYFPLIGALVAMVGRDQDPIPWLSRSIERGPTNGRAHLLLAEVLGARGHIGQSMMQLRMAVEREPALAFQAAHGIRRWARSDADVRAAVPEGSSGGPLLEALAALQPAELGPVRRRFLAEALERDPRRPSAHLALASELLTELAQGDRSSLCAGEKRSECSASVRAHAETLDTLEPRSSASTRLRARLLRLEGNPSQALKLLAGRCTTVTDRAECLQAKLEAAAECTPPTELPATIKEYLASRCGVPEDCAQASVAVGDFEAARGQWGSALSHYARATREAPTEHRWLKLADAASQVGAHSQAADALERVVKLRGGADPSLLSRIAAERAAALGDTPR